MKPFAILLRRDILEGIRSRAFIATTVVAIILVAAMLVALPFLGRIGQAPTSLVVTGQPNSLVSQTSRDLTSILSNQKLPFVVLTQGRREDANLVVMVHQSPHQSVPDYRIRVANGGTETAASILEGVLQSLTRNDRLRQAGLSPTVLAQISEPAVIPITTPSNSTHSNLPAISAIYAAMIFLFMTILMYSQMVLMGVSSEKASRVSEVLLTRVPTTSLLAAKLAGIGLAGLLQVMAVLVSALLVSLIDPRIRPLVERFHVEGISPESLALLVLFFVLGFLIYGAIFAAVGATIAHPEDARNAVTLPMMMAMVGYGLALVGIASPHLLIIKIASILPPFFPLLMMEQVSLGVATVWQWVLGLCLALGSIWGLMQWAAIIYRKNLIVEQPFHLGLLNPRQR